MAIIQWAMTIFVNPVRAPCGANPAFNVTLHVALQADAGGAIYRPFVYDDDWGPDTLLARGNRMVHRGKGWFIDTHQIPLHCTPKCEVAGAAGNSGEASTQIYGYAEEAGVIPWGVTDTRRVTVTCFEAKTVQVEKEDQARVGDLDFSGLLGAAGGTELAVSTAAEMPLSYGVAEGYQPPRSVIQVGEAHQRFEGDLAVGWHLTAGERATLSEGEGTLLRFDPDEGFWLPAECRHELDEDRLRFTVRQGGLYGLAAGDARPSPLMRGGTSMHVHEKATDDTGGSEQKS